jgi:hypothetical protein
MVFSGKRKFVAVMKIVEFSGKRKDCGCYENNEF